MGIDKTVYQDEYFLALPEKRKIISELNLEPYINHWANSETTDLLNERWMDIIGYEGSYQISNLERIKSFPNEKNKSIRILTQSLDKTTLYRKVVLTKNGVHLTHSVHRLVARHFVLNKNPEKYKQVNHLTGNKQDNRSKNLEWVTRRQDLIHKYHILKNSGFKKDRKGLNSVQAKKVIQKSTDNVFIKEWESQGDIERELGFNQSLISRACNKKTKSKGFLWEFKF